MSRSSADYPRPSSSIETSLAEDSMVFANGDPDDSEYSPTIAFAPISPTTPSHVPKSSLTGSDFSLSDTLKPSLSRSSSVSPSTKSKSPKRSPPTTNVRPRKYEILEVHPYALMGQGINMVASPGGVPDMYKSEFKKPSKQSKSKPKPRPESPGSDASTDHNKHSKLGFGRVKLLGLGGRRSRAASPEVPGLESTSTTTGGTSPPPPSLSPSASNTTLVSCDSSDGSSPSDIEPKSPITNIDFGDEDVVTHVVVGDVWERYELHEVIPILRTIKFSGP